MIIAIILLGLAVVGLLALLNKVGQDRDGCREQMRFLKGVETAFRHQVANERSVWGRGQRALEAEIEALKRALADKTYTITMTQRTSTLPISDEQRQRWGKDFLESRLKGFIIDIDREEREQGWCRMTPLRMESEYDWSANATFLRLIWWALPIMEVDNMSISKPRWIWDGNFVTTPDAMEKFAFSEPIGYVR